MAASESAGRRGAESHSDMTKLWRCTSYLSIFPANLTFLLTAPSDSFLPDTFQSLTLARRRTMSRMMSCRAARLATMPLTRQVSVLRAFQPAWSTSFERLISYTTAAHAKKEIKAAKGSKVAPASAAATPSFVDDAGDIESEVAAASAKDLKAQINKPVDFVKRELSKLRGSQASPSASQRGH